MSSKEARAREVQAAIAHVLLKYWDPIGIKDEPHAVGEYDDLVGPVYRLLAIGASAERLAAYLAEAEAGFGIQRTSPHDLRLIAERLLALDVRLDPQRRADPPP